MKKIVVYDRGALKELKKFNDSVRKDFVGLVETLSTEGRLNFPEGKRINRELFEIRVKRGGEYRSIYAYIFGDKIIILLFFQKKTQRTPLKIIKTSMQRLQKYEI